MVILDSVVLLFMKLSGENGYTQQPVPHLKVPDNLQMPPTTQPPVGQAVP